MERDPAAAAIEGFREATRCRDALRDDNWRAVQARLPARSVVPIGRSAARMWVMAAVALAAAAAAVWLGQAWWSSASVVADRGATEQASDAADRVQSPGRAHEAPASLPVTAPIAAPSPAAPPSAAAPTVDAAPGITRPVPRATPSAEVSPPAVVAPTAPDPDTLALEARAIADAHAAIVRGDLDGATAALDRHAQRHPEGALAEDRWTLRVRVACARADEDAARSAAAAFLRARPDSAVARRLAARPCTDAKNL